MSANVNPYTGCPEYSSGAYGPIFYEKCVITQLSPGQIAREKARRDAEPLKRKFWLATYRWQYPIWPKINVTFLKGKTENEQA